MKEKSNFSCFHWPEKWNLAVSDWISFVRKGPKLRLFGGQFAIQLRQGIFILSHPYGSLCHGLLCCVTKLSFTCWSAHCQLHCCPGHCGNNDGGCDVFPFFILISPSLCPVMDFVYLHSFVSSISRSVSSISPSLVPCLLSFPSHGPYIRKAKPALVKLSLLSAINCPITKIAWFFC